MWLCTKFGFFSCTCAEDRNAYDPKRPLVKHPDINTIMVRARLRSHLVALQAAVNEDPTFPVDVVHAIGAAPIIESSTNDYRFRILIPQPAFASLMVLLAEAVDYSNFKGEVASREGRSAYEEALHKVWAIMRGMALPAPKVWASPKHPDQDDIDSDGDGDGDGHDHALVGAH